MPTNARALDPGEVKLTIEASLWDYEPNIITSGLIQVDRPDRLLWSGDADTPYANRVVRATFSEENADPGIAEILDFFAERGKAFSWWVGPSSAPESLAKRLQAKGLTIMDTYEGVAMLLDDPIIIPAPDVEIVPVEGEAEVREMVRLNARIWGYSPEDEERMMADRLDYLNLPGRRGGYLLARVAGETAGTASYRYSGSGRAIYLTGASTLPEFRSRGVFRALVRRRLQDARQRGCRLATCLARVGTSAPILMKLGFEKFLSVPVFTKETQ